MADLEQMYVLGAYRADQGQDFFFIVTNQTGLLCTNDMKDAAHYLTYTSAEHALESLNAMGLHFTIRPNTKWRS